MCLKLTWQKVNLLIFQKCVVRLFRKLSKHRLFPLRLKVIDIVIYILINFKLHMITKYAVQVFRGFSLLCLTLEEDANEALIHNHVEEVPCEHDNNESSDAMEVSQAAVDESLPKEQPKVHSLDENLSEEQEEMETATGTVTQLNTTAEAPDHEKKSVRGRKARTVAAKAAEEKQEVTEDPVAPAPVRGRRGKKTAATAPSTTRQTRNKHNDVDLTVEESASQSSKVTLESKRGRNARKAFEDQAESVQEIVTEMVPEVVSEQISPVDVTDESNDTAASEKVVAKPKRGRKPKQVPEPSKLVPEVPCDNVPQTDAAKGKLLIRLTQELYFSI